ncbi:beta-lactamase-like protein [Phlebopus sp. FC_14]|nr:beta-lactamase-like protein [Phlebopus sp. FC_14]
MCRDLEKCIDVSLARKVDPSGANLPAFIARRLTASTFLITEWDDIFNEHPFIYAKIVPIAQTIMILDTGCGGATYNSDIGLKSLREFIETVDVEDNGGKPLNPQGKMRYVVVQSHCHYDHILGAEEFAIDSPILGSAHDPSFASPENLPVHSQCNVLGIRTPSYKLHLVPHLHPITSNTGNVPLGVTVMHTPGHTPDELALWDAGESMLYVGDTLYEDDPILFPDEGSIPTWFATLDKLLEFVQVQPNATEVKINCGHATAMKPALEVLEAAKQFMKDVVSGKEPLKRRFERRGTWAVEYKQASGKYSLICPEKLVLEARRIISTSP